MTNWADCPGKVETPWLNCPGKLDTAWANCPGKVGTIWPVCDIPSGPPEPPEPPDCYGSQLIASDAEAYDYFGASLAISQDQTRLIVGAPLTDGRLPGMGGSIYMFEKSGDTWVETITGFYPLDELNDQFGQSVALSSDGNILAVGDNEDWPDGGDSKQGLVRIYDWVDLDWVERAEIIYNSDSSDDDFFGMGCALSADGSILAVGAINWSNWPIYKCGAVYIYDLTESNWVERTTALTASDQQQDARFGQDVSLSGDGSILAVGAYIWDGPDGSNQGIVYVFDWNGSNWVERVEKIIASDAEENDSFGVSVELSSDGLVLSAGASGWDTPETAGKGAVYLYDWNGSNWIEREYVVSPCDDQTYTNFGNSNVITQNGEVLAVGAKYWDGLAGSSQGTVFLQTIPGA